MVHVDPQKYGNNGGGGSGTSTSSTDKTNNNNNKNSLIRKNIQYGDIERE